MVFRHALTLDGIPTMLGVLDLMTILYMISPFFPDIIYGVPGPRIRAAGRAAF